MIVVGQVRLVVTFARVDDECQVVDPEEFVINLRRLDEASFADAKVIAGVKRAAMEQSLCPPALMVDDLPEDEGLSYEELEALADEEEMEDNTLDVTTFCRRAVPTNSHADA